MNERNFTQFSTPETFLSYELSPEGTKLMAEKFGFKGDYMQAINPMSYRTYLEKEYYVNSASLDARRPPNSKGLSEIVTELTKKVERAGGKIYCKETVASITKEGDQFLLQTTKLTVIANKTVITVDQPHWRRSKATSFEMLQANKYSNQLLVCLHSTGQRYMISHGGIIQLLLKIVTTYSLWKSSYPIVTAWELPCLTS